jgi:hypothetical protein
MLKITAQARWGFSRHRHHQRVRGSSGAGKKNDPVWERRISDIGNWPDVTDEIVVLCWNVSRPAVHFTMGLGRDQRKSARF